MRTNNNFKGQIISLDLIGPPVVKIDENEETLSEAQIDGVSKHFNAEDQPSCHMHPSLYLAAVYLTDDTLSSRVETL